MKTYDHPEELMEAFEALSEQILQKLDTQAENQTCKGLVLSCESMGRALQFVHDYDEQGDYQNFFWGEYFPHILEQNHQDVNRLIRALDKKMGEICMPSALDFLHVLVNFCCCCEAHDLNLGWAITEEILIYNSDYNHEQWTQWVLDGSPDVLEDEKEAENVHIVWHQLTSKVIRACASFLEKT